MKIIYRNEKLIVCVKPAGVLSTDEPGGMPSLVREELGVQTDVRTVHQLDRVVGGLMVLALDRDTAAELGQQIMDHTFEKEYLAVIHGVLPEQKGTLRDYLARDRSERKTYVTDGPSKEAREAILDYEVLEVSGELSLVKIALRTGRTHQIRAQFSSRGYPLLGDRKYGNGTDEGDIALWSCRLSFTMPGNGEKPDFSLNPPEQFPWTEFRRRFTDTIDDKEKENG